MLNILKKKNLYIDIDGTIWDSVKAVCDMYNEDYMFHDDFKMAIPHLVNKWNMSDECPLCDNIERYFDDDRFFKYVEFMDNASIVLPLLHSKYRITLVTIGTSINLIHKFEMLRDYSWCDKFIGIAPGKDKSEIDMSGGIMIDDNSKYLRSCNAPTKILFGDKYEWNEDWDEKTEGVRCYNWYDVLEYLT